MTGHYHMRGAKTDGAKVVGEKRRDLPYVIDAPPLFDPSEPTRGPINDQHHLHMWRGETQ